MRRSERTRSLTPPGSSGQAAVGEDRHAAHVGNAPQTAILDPVNGHIIDAAQAGRIRRHRVEDRLDVGRGATDDAEDLAGRGLLLEGLRQLAVPGLELREQPHVLDGDHRLVGERLEERDLLGREGMDLGPTMDEDDAQRRALAQQRRSHDCPDVGPGLPDARRGSRELRLGRPDVLDVDRPPVAHNPSAQELATRLGRYLRSPVICAAVHAAPPRAGAPLPGGRSPNPSPRTPGRRSRRRPP